MTKAHDPRPEAGGLDPQTIEDDNDDGIGQGFGPPMDEKIVWGLIKANPHRSKPDRQRLNEIMDALFDRAPSGNPFPGERAFKDHKAVLHMAEERRNDRARAAFAVRRGERPPLIRSDTKLAEDAQKLFWPTADPKVAHATIKTLREKFSGAYERKQVAAKLKRGSVSEESAQADLKIDRRQALDYEANAHDLTPESLELQGLRRLEEELKKWGIKFIGDPGY